MHYRNFRHRVQNFRRTASNIWSTNPKRIVTLQKERLWIVLQYGPILAVLNTTKTNTRIRIFTQEFSLDINYSSPFVQCPHYPIACFQHLCTVAHNCHGKKKNLTAKRKTSRQNEKPHGKNKNLTAKRITSRQKE